jgi:Helix-turn-helix domain
MTAAKKRPRRIAADEAHAWARNLRLGNPGAKLVLSMLTQYINGDGHCFVSVQALSEDCEMAENTVRSRLKYLEEVGVLARFPQFIDELGRRNGDGKGKRTTDEIRLLMGLDEERLEAQVAARGRENVNSISPSNPEGLNPHPDDEISPSAALQQPFSSPSVALQLAAGPNSEPEPEPEPEKPPQTPPQAGEMNVIEIDYVKEVEHFPEFWRAYPDHEVMSRVKALEIFIALTPAERLHARTAASAHGEKLAKLKRKPKDAHKWLAEKGWQEYPQAKLPAMNPATAKRLIRGRELDAVMVALRIADRPLPSMISTTSEETGRCTDSTFWSRPIGPDLLALCGIRPDPKTWHQVLEGSREFWSWRERLQAWFGGDIIGERVWLEPYDPEVHGLAGSNPDFKIRKSARGFCVPWPWPPSVEGKLYPSGTGPPKTLAAEDDLQNFR